MTIDQQLLDKPVLDACCGSRMFWFNPKDPRAVYMDSRSGQWTFKTCAYKSGEITIIVQPDVVASFEQVPFPDNHFSVVVFDPPHMLVKAHANTGIMATKYGTLSGNWQEGIKAGFAECFRVLRTGGTLVFKWSAVDIKVAQVLALTPYQPLIGHRTGKRNTSHWLVFLKQ